MPRKKPVPHHSPSRAIAPDAPPTISGRWLLGALLVTVAAAALCGYATLGLLFYQGQWQLLFHPSRTITETPADVGLPYKDIRFDVTDNGEPRLDGWWIPAEAGSKDAGDAILYLHGASGSLSSCVAELAELHALGINVFAFDYQGFGRSVGRHPTERLADADAAAAWAYLTDIRQIPARNLVVFADGAGAAFAVNLAARFTPAGIVIENPSATAGEIFRQDARARILPLWLLQNEFLDPVRHLSRVHAPILFLDLGGDSRRTRALYNAAPYPREIAEVGSASAAVYAETLRRFLDQLLH